MSGNEWMLLGGVFLGGAVPWLEAIIVIPAGMLAGLAPVPVVLVAVAGNLLTVWLSAVFGQRMRDWWVARRQARPDAEEPDVTGRRERRQARIRRVMSRWGMAGLATLGPVGLGTQFSALAAVATGVRARVAFAWVGAGTVAWSVLAALLTSAGVSVAGIGA